MHGFPDLNSHIAWCRLLSRFFADSQSLCKVFEILEVLAKLGDMIAYVAGIFNTTWNTAPTSQREADLERYGYTMQRNLGRCLPLNAYSMLERSLL